MHNAFSLDIPANNCAILQSGNDLELLPAGQHCIIHPNVTLRGLYTLGENQFEMPTKDMCVNCLSLSLPPLRIMVLVDSPATKSQ
jgi:hypothetical protein